MRIAVSTSGGGLTDSVCPTFGRCPTFTLVETGQEGILNVEVIPNPGAMAGGGAGIAAAQEVARKGANAVITGNCGPNAIMVLQQAKIRVYLIPGTVEGAVKQLLKGGVPALEAPSVSYHSGMIPGPTQNRRFGRRFQGGKP